LVVIGSVVTAIIQIDFQLPHDFLLITANHCSAHGGFHILFNIFPFDALHIACAITARCDYLITVDRRMAKYQDDRIVICSPVDFINKEAGNDE
jgi:predicted nucleic acid-binding protein